MGFSKINLGLKNCYLLYIEIAKSKKREFVDYKTYSKIIKEFNLILRDKIVYKSEHVQLPYRLGHLYVHKFENTYNEENKKNWAIDYKHLKETGEIRYHGSEFGYKWKWNKKNAIVKGKKYYNFTPCRKAKRLIADAINNKQLDFYH